MKGRSSPARPAPKRALGPILPFFADFRRFSGIANPDFRQFSAECPDEADDYRSFPPFLAARRAALKGKG